MAQLAYDPDAQIGQLAIKIANLSVENSRLQVIIQAANKRIDELEKENEKLKKGAE